MVSFNESGMEFEELQPQAAVVHSMPCHLIDETSNETILYQTGNE